MMRKPKPSRSVLSRANSHAILTGLLELGGSANATSLWGKVGGNYDSLKNAASRLEENELVIITVFPGQRGYILYELTDLGRRVAAELKRAEDVLAGLDPEEAMPMDYEAPEDKGSLVR
jgi:DNA-binding MarR family transcriptional regulator